MLTMHVTKTIKSHTQRNHCNKVTDGQHKHFLLFKISRYQDIYVIRATLYSPYKANRHLLMAAPRLKPAYIIPNISSYIKQKHDSCPSLFIPRTTAIIHQLTILFTLYTSPLRHHFILHQTYLIASLIINSYHNILKASIESQHIHFICL